MNTSNPTFICSIRNLKARKIFPGYLLWSMQKMRKTFLTGQEIFFIFQIPQLSNQRNLWGLFSIFSLTLTENRNTLPTFFEICILILLSTGHRIFLSIRQKRKQISGQELTVRSLFGKPAD
jgi:hypothetical protein